MSQAIAYYNGQFIELHQAVVPIEERGLQFGDGVYEVIRIYRGVPFTAREHLNRLEQSAKAILLELPKRMEELLSIIHEGIQKTGIQDGTVYVQVTRGNAPRNHVIPEHAVPNLYLVWKPGVPDLARQKSEGVSVITVEDERWSNCYIKSTNLLPNILAKELARKQGGHEAIQMKGDDVKEGTSSNLFIVKDGVYMTPVADRSILNGITRQKLLSLLSEKQVPVKETNVTREDLLQADEVFMTSTTTEMVPVVSIDGHTVGNGKPGPAFQQLYSWFQELVSAECGAMK